ncbi:arsenate reductase ArsC [Candidatus Bathyarchaeota archaeon]|nr:arsenate reductase ArsC [Candidatus Bathyarchaeota archaeon]
MRKEKVLFLCTHNSARSQMAEGLLRHLYGDQYEVFSAGATPTQVNPFAIKVMDEIGIDISKHRSKSIEEFQDKDIDLVVSVCESSVKVICPFCSSPIIGARPEIISETLPEAKRYLHRPFSDPSEVEGSDEEKLAAFRHTRDDIRKWILDYFANLKP